KSAALFISAGQPSDATLRIRREAFEEAVELPLPQRILRRRVARVGCLVEIAGGSVGISLRDAETVVECPGVERHRLGVARIGAAPEQIGGARRIEDADLAAEKGRRADAHRLAVVGRNARLDEL